MFIVVVIVLFIFACIMDEFDFTTSLIELVKINKCLYDKNDEFYHNHNKKLNAWQKISAELDTTVFKCRTTWKNLRERYYKKVMRANKPSEKGEYIDEWPFLKPLEFLHDKIAFYSRQHRAKRGRPIEDTTEDNNTTKKSRILDQEESLPCHFISVAKNEISATRKSDEETYKLDDAKESYNEHINMRNVESATFDSLCSKFKKTIEHIEKTLCRANTTEILINEDPDDGIFMQSILMLMKTLPSDIKDEFRSNMYAQLFKLRAQVRKQNDL